MNEFDLPQVLTADEAAKALRVSPESVRRWLRDGSMQGVKFGHTWRVSRDEVLRVLQEGIEPRPVVLAGGRVHPGAPEDGSPAEPVALVGGKLLYPGGPAVMGDRDITRGPAEAGGRAPRIIG
jgi:excisionase family DNA binding protein